MPEETYSPEAVALGEASEARMREAIFSAAERASPAESLFSRLKQPFEESRIAALRSEVSASSPQKQREHEAWKLKVRTSGGLLRSLE